MLNTFKKIFILSLLVAGVSANAATINIMVHGKSSDTHCNSATQYGSSTTDVKNYWGSTNVSGIKYFAGFNGRKNPTGWGSCLAQSTFWSALYRNCRGSNTCKIITHSTGGLVVGYFFSNYGWVINSYGIRISKVMKLANAAGGSELADTVTILPSWAVIGNFNTELDSYVTTSWARSGYNHNQTYGLLFYQAMGRDGCEYPLCVTSAILPGEDDSVIAFHSSCGMSRKGSMDYCTSHVVMEGFWWWSSDDHFYQWTNHRRISSLGSSGLNQNHSELKNDGWR